MNMISTGAFQTETYASKKQPSTAEKFAAVWEKKNAKAARVGGVSLMALSLAACGSDDATTTATTPATTTTTVTETTPVVTVTPAAKEVILTTAVDQGSAFTGDGGNDTFLASDTTLGGGDSLTGGAGDDTLSYTSVTAATPAAITESAFFTSGIQTLSVTATNTAGTTVNANGMTGLTDIKSVNSTGDITVNLVSSIKDVSLEGVSSGNTDIEYLATAVAGTANTQNLTLNGVIAADSTAAGTLQMGAGAGTGIETLAITSSSAASRVTSIATGATTVTITGDANLTIDNALAGATSITATGATGNMSVVADSAGTAKDVAVTGGDGSDTADFSAGFEASDSFTGGEGTDTIKLTQAVASGTIGGTLASVEQLNVSDAGTGTIDMDDYTGLTKVIYDAGIAAGATATVDDALTGIEVEVDASNTTGALTVDLKTDGAADAITVTLDQVGGVESFGAIDASDAETLNISVDDDSTDGTGALTIASLTLGDATTLSLSGDADVTFTAVTDPTTAVLSSVNSSEMTGGLTLSAFDLVSTGGTVTLGSGDDTITFGTASGADAIDLSKGGKDTVTYTALAQSDAGDTDTITGFTAGSDDVDLRTLAGQNITTSSQFGGVGSDFTAAQGLLGGTNNVRSVYQADANRLWVDVNADGVLNNSDFRVVLSDVSTITAADLALAIAGNTVALSAAGAVANTTTNTSATALTTNEADTITSTLAFADTSTVTGGAGADSLTISGVVGATTFDFATAVAGGNTEVAITGVETVSLTQTTNGLTTVNNLTADITSLSVTGADAALSVTATANNQTLSTAANTSAGTASAITVANFNNATITTGAAGDTVIASGGAAANTNTIDTNGGADTVRLGAATALTGASNTYDGGTHATGAVDTLRLDYDVGTGNTLDLAALTTAGTIANFESLNLNADQGGTIAVTAATGYTRYAFTDATAGEIFNLTSTAAQANAITSITGDAADTVTLLISDAGSVDLSGDTMTALDAITFQDVAVDLTLDNTATAVTQGGTTAGTETTSVTFGNGGAIQSATINSTGTVTFNATAAMLATVAVGDVDTTVSAGQALQTFAGVAGATAVINVTGAGGNFMALDATPTEGDDDLVYTNIDTMNVNTTSQSIIVAAVQNAEADFTINLGAFSGHEVHLDSNGTQDAAVTITGFAAGVGGDKILLNEATNIGATDITTFNNVATTGLTLAGLGTAVGAAVNVVVASGSTMQVSGALTQTGDAGAVEAALIASGIAITGGSAANEALYFAADNGTQTGLYRVFTASGNMADVNVNAANEFAVTHIATIDVADASLLTADNFAS
jgi:hypothetical protein